MANSLLRTNRELTEIYDRNIKMLYRVCFAYMKNPSDTEDAVQETFYKLIQSAPAFENTEHEKAWLLQTAGNLCKNTVRNWWRKRENIEDHAHLQNNNHFEIDTTLEAVMGLPDKYKTVVYLYYYEGYNSAEIAAILKKPPSTVRNYLHEARGILEKKLGGDLHEK